MVVEESVFEISDHDFLTQLLKLALAVSRRQVVF